MSGLCERRRVFPGGLDTTLGLLALFLLAIPASGCSRGRPLALMAKQTAKVSRDLVYQLTPTTTGLWVKVSFRGHRTGQTELGALREALPEVEALSPDTSVRLISDGAYRIAHPPLARVRLSYHLATRASSVIPSLLRRQHLLAFEGRAALLLPQHLRSRKSIRVRLSWISGPGHWRFVSSLGAGRRIRRTIEPQLLRIALFLGGSIEVTDRQLSETRLLFAHVGRWSQRRVFESFMASAIGEARYWWRDERLKHFLAITFSRKLKLISDGARGIGGFGMMILRRDPAQRMTLRWKILCLHELMHSWFGGRLVFADTPDWFLEGLATHYAFFLLVRLGVLTLPELVKLYNMWFGGLARLSSKRGAPRGANRYFRAALYALRLGAAIARHDRRKSLKSVLEGSFGPQRRTRLTRGKLERLLLRNMAAAKQSRMLVAELSLTNARLVLPRELGLCVSRRTERMPALDPGFDLPASRKTGAVTGVKRGHPAHAAGLRNGQPFKSANYLYVNNRSYFEARVRTRGSWRTLRYLPHGRPIEIHQLVLDKARFKRDPALCMRPFNRPAR